VRAVLEALHDAYPGLYRCLCNATGAVRTHIHLFVNDDFLHHRNGLDTRLESGAVLSVFQAVSGG
jgi:molybdopterin converting factor small subunit